MMPVLLDFIISVVVTIFGVTGFFACWFMLGKIGKLMLYDIRDTFDCHVIETTDVNIIHMGPIAIVIAFIELPLIKLAKIRRKINFWKEQFEAKREYEKLTKRKNWDE